MMGFQSCTVAHCLVARRILINAAVCNLCLICACRQPFTAVQEWIDCTLLTNVTLLSMPKSSAQRASVDQNHNLRVLENRLATKLSWSGHRQKVVKYYYYYHKTFGTGGFISQVHVRLRLTSWRHIRLPGWDEKTKRRSLASWALGGGRLFTSPHLALSVWTLHPFPSERGQPKCSNSVVHRGQKVVAAKSC